MVVALVRACEGGGRGGEGRGREGGTRLVMGTTHAASVSNVTVNEWCDVLNSLRITYTVT